MSHTIHEAKACHPRTRREVLRGPRIGHRHPDIKAEKHDQRANKGSHQCLARQRDQYATNKRDYGSNGKPVLPLQAFAKDRGNDRTRNEAKDSYSGDQTGLWRRIAERGEH